MPGQPMINFSVHEVRAGIDGAHADFEQMLALLVQATCGEANLVFANPGDWGIDVLVGDLRGQVTIWQAKYFVRGFRGTQEGQVRDAFASALKAASAHGYEVARWILCLPSSMDGPATQWWQGWKARQQDSGVRIELWDETRLRALLIRPEAAHVRRHYYNPYRHDDATEEPGWLTGAGLAPAAGGPEPEAAWVGGAEYRLADSLYLLHDEPSERTSRDLSWVWREATADLIEPGEGRVRLRQVRVLRRLPAAEQQQAGLRAQAGLLARLDRRARPAAPARDLRGEGPRGRGHGTPAGMAVGRGLRARSAGGGPAHRRGHPCRRREPVCGPWRAARARGQPPCAAPGRHFRPRRPVPGPRRRARRHTPVPGRRRPRRTRAPEQERAPYATGASTDVYQLAAVVYHTLTGYPPAPAGSPPIRAAVPGFPEKTERALLSALDRDPAQRPASAATLAAALRAGRTELSRGGR